MKLTFRTPDLKSALSGLCKVVSNASPSEVLKGVLIRAEGVSVDMTASNTSGLVMTTRVPAVVEEEGAALLPASTFQGLISNVSAPETQLWTDGPSVRIKCGASRSRLSAMDPNDYPTVGEMPDQSKGFRIAASLLKDSLGTVLPFASVDENRIMLTGVKFEIDSKDFRMVALDGFRMAISDKEIDTRSYRKYEAVIPSSALRVLDKVLPSTDDSVEILISKGNAAFNWNGTSLITVLLTGNFLDYSPLLPSEFTTETKVTRSQFNSAVSRAAVVAKEGRNNLLRLSITRDAVTVRSMSSQSDLVDDVPCFTTGKDLEIAFNTNFLQQICKLMSAEEILIRLNTPTSPAIFVPFQEYGQTFLVLPVRTTD